MAKKKPDIADIDDDRVVFVVSFYIDDQDELCCEGLGDTSSPEMNKAMAGALRSVAAHIEGATKDEVPNGQLH